MKLFQILCILGGLGLCLAATSTYHRNRITSFDELREIDGYVSSGLPLFEHGFFVSTAQGPILVKAKEEGNGQNKPRLNPGYYSTLPRLIPAGYEGISISHFNLGTSIPAQHPSLYTHHPIPQFTHAPQGHYHPQQSAPAPLTTHRVEPRPALTRSGHFVQHPQRRHDQVSPVAQDTFQINNFLDADDHDVPTSYQTTMIAHEPTEQLNQRSHDRLARNPTVEQAIDYEDSLPEDLKNPFYKNRALAEALAQESLPTEGETVVGEWDTTKIQKQRIGDLLRAAGFLR